MTFELAFASACFAGLVLTCICGFSSIVRNEMITPASVRFLFVKYSKVQSAVVLFAPVCVVLGYFRVGGCGMCGKWYALTVCFHIAGLYSLKYAFLERVLLISDPESAFARQQLIVERNSKKELAKLEKEIIEEKHRQSHQKRSDRKGRSPLNSDRPDKAAVSRAASSGDTTPKPSHAQNRLSKNLQITVGLATVTKQAGFGSGGAADDASIPLTQSQQGSEHETVMKIGLNDADNGEAAVSSPQLEVSVEPHASLVDRSSLTTRRLDKKTLDKDHRHSVAMSETERAIYAQSKIRRINKKVIDDGEESSNEETPPEKRRRGNDEDEDSSDGDHTPEEKGQFGMAGDLEAPEHGRRTDGGSAGSPIDNMMRSIGSMASNNQSQGYSTVIAGNGANNDDGTMKSDSDIVNGIQRWVFTILSERKSWAVTGARFQRVSLGSSFVMFLFIMMYFIRGECPKNGNYGCRVRFPIWLGLFGGAMLAFDSFLFYQYSSQIVSLLNQFKVVHGKTSEHRLIRALRSDLITQAKWTIICLMSCFFDTLIGCFWQSFDNLSIVMIDAIVISLSNVMMFANPLHGQKKSATDLWDEEMVRQKIDKRRKKRVTLS